MSDDIKSVIGKESQQRIIRSIIESIGDCNTNILKFSNVKEHNFL